MLKYADDIVSVDKNEIIHFFKERKITYRDDYIDFLAQFGGNYSRFFRTYNFNCTFQEIKEIYLEAQENDIPEGYCVFGNQLVSDFYFIENKTGKIYNESYDEDDNFCFEKASFESINTFIWDLLYSISAKEIIIQRDIFENLSKFEVQNFLSEVSEFQLFESGEFNAKYYMKNNKVYFFMREIVTWQSILYLMNS